MDVGGLLPIERQAYGRVDGCRSSTGCPWLRFAPRPPTMAHASLSGFARRVALPLVPAVSGCASEAPPPGSDWRLLWSDEFDGGPHPSTAHWGYDVGGGGWGNGESQYYTEGRLQNARLEGGRLVIEAHREAFGGHGFTSARLVTRGRADWRYGRVEIRARLPQARGTWPAFWMLPSTSRYGTWPENGEIDLMEHVGHEPGVVFSTVHTARSNHLQGTQRPGARALETATTAFHVYALEWEADEIRAYVDGRLHFTFANERRLRPDATHREWPFDQPFYLILNLAVGGTLGGARGIDAAAWPQRLDVEYVRVYQRAEMS